MAEGAVVVDTSLLLYLGRIGHLELLPSLFSKAYVPEQVALELDVGRVPRIDTVNPGALSWTTIVSVSEIEMILLHRLRPHHTETNRRLH